MFFFAFAPAFANPGKSKVTGLGRGAGFCVYGKNPGKITGESCKVLCTDFSLNMAGSIFISGSDCVGEVRLPDGITAISPYAFSGNRQITRIILPDSLRVIGEGAFWGCSSLVRVDFPSSFCVIGARAFEKCTALLEIRLCARHIKARAFACCTALKTAELAGLQALENHLFEHCTSLEKCSFGQIKESCTGEILPAHRHKIGDYCFSGCGRLNTISLTSVREIGSYAFQNCDGLSSISLDDDTILHPHAFADCGGLEQIRLTGKRRETAALCIRPVRVYGFSAGYSWEQNMDAALLSGYFIKPPSGDCPPAFSQCIQLLCR